MNLAKKSRKLTRVKIRIQVVGGLGNQLFIWNAAHHLQTQFNSQIDLVFIEDNNWRSDRRLELERMSRHCEHSISIFASKKLGLLFKVLDKYKLEQIRVSRWLLQSLGIYNFENPVSELAFNWGKPRLIRSYFQRTNLVDLSWDSWKPEFEKALKDLEVNGLPLKSQFNIIHVRRGDSLSLASTFGVLEDSYFENQENDNVDTYVCTDDLQLSKSIEKIIQPAKIFTPNELDAWQTLKLFCEAANFLGSNSTMSWWACYFRIKNGRSDTRLPSPWTRRDLGYETALHINGVRYKEAKYVDAE